MGERYGKKTRELMVKEMEDLFRDKKGIFFSTFGNVKAGAMDEFRKKVHRSGLSYKILKKRLGKKAMGNLGISGFDDLFGSEKNMGVMVGDDPVAVAKLLKAFTTENKEFVVTAGYLEGQILTPDDVKKIADLPSREQLLAMVVGMMNSPISGFVNVLASVLRSMVNVINAIKKSKEEA